MWQRQHLCAWVAFAIDKADEYQKKANNNRMTHTYTHSCASVAFTRDKAYEYQKMVNKNRITHPH